jgi:hypothetical protein
MGRSRVTFRKAISNFGHGPREIREDDAIPLRMRSDI